jgi:outer membrane protein OmpA-like peptidoglycan-associated protein
VNTAAVSLEGLFSPSVSDGVDRAALAGLLIELARSLDANVGIEPPSIVPFDARLEHLRTLLLGREIELSRHFSQVLDDPEQLALAVSRVLPAAIAQAAARDERLGQVLAPALGSSVRRNPGTLVDILHPLMGPAIAKSIEATFQSLNESLKHSLSWRGLKWRLEAWRTGISFAEVVLKHTLVYRVEHVFLIHRETGLLVAHAAAPDAASQDPQVVSSMLAAIQDFIRDSFAEQHGLDSLRLGELTVWSEPGPFAALVAVIRGNPPEKLHDVFRSMLGRIHTERHDALKNFEGDSSTFGDVDAALNECVQLRHEAPRAAQTSFAWLVVGFIGLTIAGLLGIGVYQRWQEARLWDNALARLRAEPGIVITEIGERDGMRVVSGLRDPLATDPELLLRESSIDPARVVTHWRSYQSLTPRFVLERAREALAPPATVRLSIDGDRLVAVGSAPSAWIERARAFNLALPAGLSQLNLSQVSDPDEAADRLWQGYVARLRALPGIVITEVEKRNSHWLVRGLRDPLAVDPQLMLRESAVDPARVIMDWLPYQSIAPRFVLERAREALIPPATVTLSIEGDKLVAVGSAPSTWIERARAFSLALSAGVSHLDLSQVSDPDEADDRLWHDYVAQLRGLPGIAITEIEKRHGNWLIRGLRDPLAVDPVELLRETPISPTRVVMQWEPYQSLHPEFLLIRARDALAPPPTVTFDIEGKQIVVGGSASLAWIKRARAASLMLPAGAFRIDFSKVRDINDGALGKIRDAIESTEILFDFRNPLPARGQEQALDRLAAHLKDLTALASKLSVTPRVTLAGHADATGQSLHNLTLGLARAEAVRALLKQRGVNPDLLAVRSVGTLEPRDGGAKTESAHSVNRRVGFTVGIDDPQ